MNASRAKAFRHIWVGLVGGLLVLIALGSYLYLRSSIGDRMEAGVRVVGTVVDSKAYRAGRSSHESRLTIQYEVEGKTVEVKAMSLNFGSPGVTVGDKIDIFYDTKSPDKMATISGYASEGMILVLTRLIGVIGLCVLLAALVQFVATHRKEK